jgi:hypothetical protein
VLAGGCIAVGFADFALAGHAREDIGKISEPQAQALFETTAEVCTGLIKAYDDYEKKAPAWQ